MSMGLSSGSRCPHSHADSRQAAPQRGFAHGGWPLLEHGQTRAMHVRAATVDDADAIAAVNAAAWRMGFQDVADPKFLATYDGFPDTRRTNLAELPPEAVQLVAVEGERVVGWIAAQPCEDDDCDPETTYEVRACYVAPDHWRGGVGRTLMNCVLNNLDRGKWQEVVIWTPADTSRSHSFYESFGFTRDGS